MPRMKQLAPRGRSLKPRGQTGAQPARIRDRVDTWRAWYKTAEWQRLRWQVLGDAMFACARCGLIGQSRELVADHVQPHRGDRALFFDRSNLQCLCATCHNRDKQREERAQRDASHPSSGAMSRPSWFRKSHVPLTVVCGPPGSGKSTWVSRQAQPGDLIVCFDMIATAMFGRDGQDRVHAGLSFEQRLDVLRRRNEILGGLMHPSGKTKWPAAWLIVTEPKAMHRQWWNETVGADVVVLATPHDECMRRIMLDDQAGDRRSEGAKRAVAEWWETYTVSPVDRTIAP